MPGHSGRLPPSNLSLGISKTWKILLALLGLFLGWFGCLAAKEASVGVFENYHYVPPTNGSGARWLRRPEVPAASFANLRLMPLFRAVRPDAWVRGLVPIYSVELDSRTELRRLPGRGQENFSEPRFFALPNEDEPPEVAQITGRWEVSAIRSDKSPATFAWELAGDPTGKVAGRFEQLTDFRFAYLTSGWFRSNQLSLTVEYISDRYAVRGTWAQGGLRGTWRHSEDADHGTWAAKSTAVEPPVWQTSEVVPLYEWSRPNSASRYYGVQAPEPNGDWEKAARPLCRVWRLVSLHP